MKEPSATRQGHLPGRTVLSKAKLFTSVAVFMLGLALFLLGVGSSLRNEAAEIPIPDDLSRLDPILVEHISATVQAIRQERDSAEKHGNLGMLYEAHHHVDLAMRCYQNASAVEPTNAIWRYRWAVLADAVGDVTRAEQALRDVVAAAPDYAPAHERLGLLLLERNAHSEAAGCFQRVIRLSPNRPQGYIRLAAVELAKKRFDAAVERLSKALTIDPTNAEARYLLGRAYHGLGRVEHARIEFARGGNAQRVLLPDPWRMDIALAVVTAAGRFERATTLITRGRLAEAVAILEQLLQRDTRNVDVINHLAVAYLQLDRNDEAQRILDSAYMIKPHHLATNINLALALRAKGDLPGALAYAEEACCVAPTATKAFVTKASILGRMGRYEDALDAFRRASHLDAGKAGLHIAVGEMLAILERWDEASQAFEESVALQPQSTNNRYKLGLTYSQTGRFDLAVTAYRAALALDPNNRQAQRALREVESLRQKENTQPNASSGPL